MKYKCLVIVFLVLAFSQTISAQSSVWKVENGKSHIYIGGTIHVLRDVDYPLPLEYEKAFKYADKLVFETDIDGMSNPEIIKEMMSKFSYSDGRTLKSDLSEKAYDELVKEAKRQNIPIEKMESFKPSMVLLTLTLQGLKDIGVKEDGVDKYYNEKSKLLSDKETDFLESVEFQINLLTSLGEGRESEYVLSSLKDYKTMKTEFLEIISGWKNGETKYFENHLKEMKKDYPEMYKSMLLERNNSWIPKIDDFFNDKKTEFLLVGNLHLHGENGILKLLEKKGYKISQLKITKQEKNQLLKEKDINTEELKKSVVKEWEIVHGEKFGFTALTPGKVDLSNKTISSESGNLKLDIFSFTPKKPNDNLIYIIIHSLYPERIIHSSDEDKIESFFKSAIERIVSKSKGKLISEKDIKLNGYPGKEVSINSNANEGLYVIRLRLYLVKSKLYMLQVVSEMKKAKNESSNKFIESLRLIEENKN